MGWAYSGLLPHVCWVCRALKLIVTKSEILDNVEIRCWLDESVVILSQESFTNEVFKTNILSRNVTLGLHKQTGLGWVVQKLVNTNPGLKVNKSINSSYVYKGSNFLCFKYFKINQAQNWRTSNKIVANPGLP